MEIHTGETYTATKTIKLDDGEYTDPDTITITITNPDGTLLVNEAIPTRTDVGRYSYDFTAPELIGTYTLKWEMVIEDEEFQVSETLVVRPSIDTLITTFNAKLISEDDTFKKGTHGQTIVFQLLKQENTPINLESGIVKLILKKGELRKEFEMSIFDSEEGTVYYTFLEGDLSLSGMLNVEIQITGTDKKIISENSVKIKILR